MALGKCQDCEQPMSDSAKSCPHCGSTKRAVKWIKNIKLQKERCSCCKGDGEYYHICYMKREGHKEKRFFGDQEVWEPWEEFTDHGNNYLKDSLSEIKFNVASRRASNRYGYFEEIKAVGTEKAECHLCKGLGEIAREIEEGGWWEEI